ncbi:MAG: GNAT family N-acetyltransferase [Propionibacteriales bacterium]|nr:GNAT family N-acetyltransferase [Propionibacteriales bacterium]
MATIEQVWPVFRLRIRSGPLELAPVRDDDIPALVELAERGIHHPTAMPFAVPWTEAADGELGGSMAMHFWRSRATFSRDAWELELVVRREGQIVGLQSFAAERYLVTRTGGTGSWLGLEHQGQGTGTLMRQTICAFLFDHLDAEEVTSAAFTDNPASMAVSRKIGYSLNGQDRRERRDGELAICRRLVLQPQDFVRSGFELQVDGLAGTRALIGLQP